MFVSNKTAKCDRYTNTSIQTYLRSWTIDVRLVHLNGIMFQSKHVVRKNNGFVTTSLMISYQILCASELAGVHDIQKLQDIFENLVQQDTQQRHGRARGKITTTTTTTTLII
jgi:hypothetical protein